MYDVDTDIKEGKKQVANFCVFCRTPVTWAESKRAYWRMKKLGAPDEVCRQKAHRKCAANWGTWVK